MQAAPSNDMQREAAPARPGGAGVGAGGGVGSGGVASVGEGSAEVGSVVASVGTEHVGVATGTHADVAERAAEASGQDVFRLRGKMADRDSWSAGDDCSVGRALDVVGTRSAMLIMREAFYGTTRFDDFAKRVGITEAAAAARLKDLLAEGLFNRTPYREPGQRTRYEYRLTDKGRDLLPAALALMQWGDRYLAEVPGGPVRVRHEDCGAEVRVEVRCTEGHEVALEDLTAQFRSPERAAG